MKDWYFRDRYFPPSTPRVAKGGIRAQSKQGFGESWWAKRWIAVLEGFQIASRLQRGRRYARSGQVLSIEVKKSRISAKVQGSRPEPYAVIIQVKPLGQEAWAKVAEAVSAQAVFASKLLAGEMPQEMEEVFRGVKLSLFPERYGDLVTECSCPDWSNPCKHVAAVYYLLGEEFDRDPFLIFKVRGMEREEFLSLMGESGEAAWVESPAHEPLPVETEAFWAAEAIPENLTGEPPPNQAGAALAKRLGKFPFWRGSHSLIEVLEPVYLKAAEKAAELLARRGPAP
jgi:uncharacterized Zn finger protein